MDYDKIVNATYNWFSLDKLFWFLLFFWLSIPVLVFAPQAMEKGFFSSEINWIVMLLYAILYFGVLLGFIVLTTAFLNRNKLNTKEVTPWAFVDTIKLVFVELFYIFIWNLHKPYRLTQLLLLVGVPLLYLYKTFNSTAIIYIALIIFSVIYLVMVLYNGVRLFFSVLVFYNTDYQVVDAVKHAWSMTHQKFNQTFMSILLIVGIVAVIFLFIATILSGIANLFLIQYFISPLAFNLSLSIGVLFALAPALICYYSAITELYTQLAVEHTSSHRVKRILMRRVLTPKEKVKKKTVKKKAKKKVKRKKKTIKNKVKKKTTKKKAKKKK